MARGGGLKNQYHPPLACTARDSIRVCTEPELLEYLAKQPAQYAIWRNKNPCRPARAL